MLFFSLVVKTVSRTSSGKFLRVESCYPESFGFLCLCLTEGHKGNKGDETGGGDGGDKSDGGDGVDWGFGVNLQ